MDSGRDIVEEDPEAETKEEEPRRAVSAEGAGRHNIIEVHPDADTKEEEPRRAASIEDAGRHNIIEVDHDADTKVNVDVANTANAGCDNEKRAKPRNDFSSRDVSVKLGVPSSGLEKDNSVADSGIVVEENPEAETQVQLGGGTDENKVVFSYSPLTPKRLKEFYPKDKVIGDGVMVFGRLAPSGGVQVKLNDTTISQRQFSLTLVHKSDEWYFVFKNLSRLKKVFLNEETLGLDESRRLPQVSRLRIRDLDSKYGEGQSMDFLLCVETSNRWSSYIFEVTFKADSNLDFAMNTPGSQLNAPVQCSLSANASPEAPRRCHSLDDNAFQQ